MSIVHSFKGFIEKRKYIYASVRHPLVPGIFKLPIKVFSVGNCRNIVLDEVAKLTEVEWLKSTKILLSFVLGFSFTHTIGSKYATVTNCSVFVKILQLNMNFSTFNCIQNTLKIVVPLLGLTSLILLSNQNLNFYKHISKLSLPNENIGVKNESQFAKIRKAILVSPMFKAVPGYAGEFPENCSVTCDIYQYKEIKPTEIGKVDAIMFHLTNGDMELMRPFLSQSDSRPKGQIWTIFTSEPAIKLTKLGQDRYVKNGIFNWTISFRSDSTIPTISKRIVEFQNVTNKPKEKFRHLQILDKFNISRLETKKAAHGCCD